MFRSPTASIFSPAGHGFGHFLKWQIQRVDISSAKAMDTSNENRDKKRAAPDASTVEFVGGSGRGAKSRRRAQKQQRAATLTDLTTCIACACEMVYPIDWAPAQSRDRRWHVVLRCPNCESIADGTFHEDLIERYDSMLDRGTDALVGDLCRLTRANMADEIDTFVAALTADAILPEDF